MTTLTMDTALEHLTDMELTDMRYGYLCIHAKFHMVTRHGWTTLLQGIEAPSRFNAMFDVIKSEGVEIYKNYNNGNGIEISFNKRHVKKVIRCLNRMDLSNLHIWMEVVDQDNRLTAHPLIDQDF